MKLCCQVRVKRSVIAPKYKWGLVTRDSVGKVVNIDGANAMVDFDEQQRWTCLLAELEKVPEQHPNVHCDQCQVGDVFFQ